MKKKSKLKNVILIFVFVILGLLIINSIFMIINFIRVSKDEKPIGTFYSNKYDYNGLFYSAHRYDDWYLSKRQYVIKAFGKPEDPLVELNKMFEYMTQEQKDQYMMDVFNEKEKEDNLISVPIQIPPLNNN